MLKSHLRLQPMGVEEEVKVEEEEDIGEQVQVEEYIEVKGPPRCLNRSEVSVRLCFLGKTADGDGYTYLKANLVNMKLTNITALKSFIHLQYIDLSKNMLELSALQEITSLPYLVFIQADHNLLTSAALNKMQYLQVIVLNNNNITSVHDVYQPELSTLEVGFNKIQKVYFENRMPNIKCLDFRNNRIMDIADLNFPKLDSLYLANNKIMSLVGLERLVNLRILHVRNNPIRLLDGFHEDLKKLIYVNLRNCKVTTLKQVKKLRVLQGIETLILKGCPYMGGTGEEDADAGGGGDEEDDAETRIETLAALPRLKRLNKTVVSPEEREEAKTLMLQWIEDDERDEEEMEPEEHGEGPDEAA